MRVNVVAMVVVVVVVANVVAMVVVVVVVVVIIGNSYPPLWLRIHTHTRKDHRTPFLPSSLPPFLPSPCYLTSSYHSLPPSLLPLPHSFLFLTRSSLFLSSPSLLRLLPSPSLPFPPLLHTVVSYLTHYDS